MRRFLPILPSPFHFTQAVAELLAAGAEPNLPLGKAIGNALCAVVNPAYEQNTTLANKIALVRKVVNNLILAFQK